MKDCAGSLLRPPDENKAPSVPRHVAVERNPTRWALFEAFDRQPVNVTIADLPGPQVPLSLAGAQLLEVFPVLPLRRQGVPRCWRIVVRGPVQHHGRRRSRDLPRTSITTSAPNELQALAAASVQDSKSASRPKPESPTVVEVRDAKCISGNSYASPSGLATTTV